LLTDVSNAPAAGSTKPSGSGGFFNSIFKGKAVKHAATVEGEYADTRHVGQMRPMLEQFITNQLPTDKFAATGPQSAASAKAEAKSVRKFGVNSRWAKKDAVQFTGGRYIVFVAGGMSYPELKVGYELMTQQSKEIIMGTSHIITPFTYMNDVSNLSNSSSLGIQGGKKREDNL
jgi:syntaxin-binding protein 1